MQTRHFPFQDCKRIAGMGKILAAAHLFELPGSLRGATRAQVTGLALKAVRRAHDPVRVAGRHCLLQFLHQFRRFFEKNVAQVPEQFLIASNTIQGIGSVP